MMIPGSNILKIALASLGQQTVTYHRFVSRETNAVGNDVAVYAPAQTIRGSFQPVPRRLYKASGLEFNKNYATFYAPCGMIDVQRDVSGDQITFCERIFQVLNANDWHAIDGWVGVLCVQIGGQDVG